MEKRFYHDLKLGILGGGQLGRMLIQEAINFNIYTSVLDPDPNAPCKDLSNSFFVGDLKDFDLVYTFGKNKDVVTIEIENVNVDALEKLEKEGVKVFPQPNVLRIIQDKGEQKLFYQANKIPTSEFFLVEDRSEISLFNEHFPFMQKMRRGGYDGKGVTKLDNPNDLSTSFDAPSVLEKLVDIDKEISVIVARNENGDMKVFPPVEMVFNYEANLVDYLFSPAELSKELSERAEKLAIQVIDSLEMTGILAVEMFLNKEGELLVNEIAPRPHNSGHQTIEGNHTSQYQQHLRSVLNLPLGDTGIKCPSVMVNLLGEKNMIGDAIYEGLNDCLAIEGVNIHLYGKKITKPFRKMGHVTISDHSLEEAKKKAFKVKETLKVKA